MKRTDFALEADWPCSGSLRLVTTSWMPPSAGPQKYDRGARCSKLQPDGLTKPRVALSTRRSSAIDQEGSTGARAAGNGTIEAEALDDAKYAGCEPVRRAVLSCN
ncbi:hypothetical protein [Caballeronia sp. LZ065]|uniref:hypothetical protein n=1 Tax=Caballeronia sp. LZ065 TaxID=3038571 RepID=UPI00286C0760|nr:hypothetical protein [Caballeronia sp. LZ065]